MVDNLSPRLALARRLRALGHEHWPGRRLTQPALAQALAGDFQRLSVPLIASWESVTSPKTPPVARLEAYATFFATPRSIEGGPHLLNVQDLTDEEGQARESFCRS